MRSIDEKIKQIEANRRDIAGDHDEVDQWAHEEMSDLWPRIFRVKRPNAYSRFVMQFISEYDPADHTDADGEPKPPCTCANDCPIIEGRLPASIEAADKQASAAERWALEHNGEPHALRQADEEYRELLADIYTGLHRVERGTRSKQIVEPYSEDATPGEEPDKHGDKPVPADD